MKNDGGYVHPSLWNNPQSGKAGTFRGISRRDWLAGLAMQGILHHPEFQSVPMNYKCPSCDWPSLVIMEGKCPSCQKTITKKEFDAMQGHEMSIPKVAYRLADAMIAEGNKDGSD